MLSSHKIPTNKVTGGLHCLVAKASNIFLQDGNVNCGRRQCRSPACTHPSVDTCNCPDCNACFYHGNTYATGQEFVDAEDTCNNCICEVPCKVYFTCSFCRERFVLNLCISNNCNVKVRTILVGVEIFVHLNMLNPLFFNYFRWRPLHNLSVIFRFLNFAFFVLKLSDTLIKVKMVIYEALVATFIKIACRRS